MKTLTTLLIAAILFTPIQALALGGDDPVPGIDVIIKEAGLDGNVDGIRIYLGHYELKQINGHKGLEKPDTIAKITAAKISKKMPEFRPEGSWYKTLRSGLVKNWCVKCNGGKLAIKVKGEVSGKSRMSKTVVVYFAIKKNQQVLVGNQKAKIKANAMLKER